MTVQLLKFCDALARRTVQVRRLRPFSRLRVLAAAMVTLVMSFASSHVAAVPLTCSWEVETTPLANNFAFPDTNAIYWTSRFVYEAGLEFQITGTFPDARYMSFNTYNSTGNSFTVVDGGQTFSTSIPDYLIAPNPGSFNPYATTAAVATPRAFTLQLKLNPAGTVGNVLPLAPIDPTALPPVAPLPGDIGYFIMRAYLKSGAVLLPTVSYRSTAQPSLLAVPQCPATPGSNNPPNLSNDSCSGLGCGALAFARSPSTGGNFPNADTVYVSARVAPPLTDTRVVVVRGLAPESPTGSLPRPWPNTGVYETRYWSMCNNVSSAPNPVVVNTVSPGVLSLGCRSNDDSNLLGAFATGGYYTYVLGRESQRIAIEQLTWPGINFLPFSSSNPQNEHLLLLRNMVPDSTFAYATKNVPAGSTPAQTQQIMGSYYPRAAYCLLSVLQAQGPDACVLPLPDLSISKTHVGNFARGQIGAIYTVIVSNVGQAEKAAANVVSVTESVPSGLSLTAMAGSGWTCVTTPQPQCARSDALAAGQSYPPITVAVSVVANASSPQINSVSVAAAAQESNSNNNTTSDSTTIVTGTMGSLAVSRRGSGTGTVASLDGGINCGAGCANAYVNGSGIAMLATPMAAKDAWTLRRA